MSGPKRCVFQNVLPNPSHGLSPTRELTGYSWRGAWHKLLLWRSAHTEIDTSTWLRTPVRHDRTSLPFDIAALKVGATSVTPFSITVWSTVHTLVSLPENQQLGEGGKGKVWKVWLSVNLKPAPVYDSWFIAWLIVTCRDMSGEDSF